MNDIIVVLILHSLHVYEHSLMRLCLLSIHVHTHNLNRVHATPTFNRFHVHTMYTKNNNQIYTVYIFRCIGKSVNNIVLNIYHTYVLRFKTCIPDRSQNNVFMGSKTRHLLLGSKTRPDIHFYFWPLVSSALHVAAALCSVDVVDRL